MVKVKLHEDHLLYSKPQLFKAFSVFIAKFNLEERCIWNT